MVDSGFLDHAYDNITPEDVAGYFKESRNLQETAHLRFLKLVKPTEKNFKIISGALNKMAAGAGVVTAGKGIYDATSALYGDQK